MHAFEVIFSRSPDPYCFIWTATSQIHITQEDQIIDVICVPHKCFYKIRPIIWGVVSHLDCQIITCSHKFIVPSKEDNSFYIISM